MRNMFWGLLAMILLFTSLAFSQDVLVSDLIPMSNEDFMASLVASLGGMKSFTVLGVIFVLVQTAMKFLGTPWADSLINSGKWKLTIYVAMSLVGGICGLMVSQGLTFQAALVHSSTFAAFGVFLHQIYKQFVKKD